MGAVIRQRIPRSGGRQLVFAGRIEVRVLTRMLAVAVGRSCRGVKPSWRETIILFGPGDLFSLVFRGCRGVLAARAVGAGAITED
ncbi:hypothetical protein [Saccharopolyspora sp. NPDC002376]